MDDGFVVPGERGEPALLGLPHDGRKILLRFLDRVGRLHGKRPTGTPGRVKPGKVASGGGTVNDEELAGL